MFLVFQGYNSCALKIAITKGYEEPHKNTKDIGGNQKEINVGEAWQFRYIL